MADDGLRHLEADHGKAVHLDPYLDPLEPEPARYLAIGMGSRRYPFSTIRREGAAGKADTDIKKGGRQIEYADQDPRLHQQWLDAIAETGVTSDMGEYIDESQFRN